MATSISGSSAFGAIPVQDPKSAIQNPDFPSAAIFQNSTPDKAPSNPKSAIQNPKSSSPGVIERPEVEESTPNTHGGWIVVVYDNDHNTVEEVIAILMIATSCTFEEAHIETWEVHHLGKSVVHHGKEEECRNAAAVIARIGIQVEVREE